MISSKVMMDSQHRSLELSRGYHWLTQNLPYGESGRDCHDLAPLLFLSWERVIYTNYLNTRGLV
jgi:hypothetical protein